MPVILEANASHPGPTLERVYPTKSRYGECIVGCTIFEDVFEVTGDEVVIARVRPGRRHCFAGQGNITAPLQQDNDEQERRCGNMP
jgi:hypothetical protein